MEHREICLEIYGKQKVELKSGSTEVKNYFKQIAVPFEIYADIECNLEKNHIFIYNRDKNTSYNENIKIIFLVVLLTKLVCIDDKFSKPVFFYRGKNEIYKLIEAIREEYDYWKQVTKGHFNENLIISVENEKIFQSSNKCLKCNKLFTKKDKKSKRSWSYNRKI